MGRSDNLRRSGWSREPLARYLIVCEGAITEKSYFSDLRHLERIPIEMKIIAGAVPKTLVEIAVKEKKDAERSAKRKDNGFVKYDEVWVVFDVDTHPSIAEAKQQAAANGVHIAISNPCFELWAVLHFRDQNAHLDTAAMRRLCGECIPGYGKRLPCSDLMKQVEQAIARAEKLRSWHESRGTPGANPSTNVDELVGSIRQQRAPR